MNPEKTFGRAVFLYGFVGTAIQVFLLRRFLVVFGGNELAVTTGLVFWLLYAGVGSWLFGSFCHAERQSFYLLFSSALLFASLPSCVFLGLHLIKPLLGHAQGQAFTPDEIILATACVLFIPSLLWGASFSGLCLLGKGRGVSPEGVFFIEALGAGTGGVFFTFLLLPFFSDWFIGLGIGILCVVLATFLATLSRSRASLITLVLVEVCLLLIMALTIKRPVGDEWNGMTIVSYADGPYGSTTAVSSGDQTSVYESGRLAFTYPDAEAVECLVHLPLLERPEARTLLLIGGGPAVLREAVKRPLEEIHYIELDPLLLHIVEEASSEWRRTGRDPSVVFIQGDAREYIREHPSRFDAVILCVGDPTTLQINRLFTLEFYQTLRNSLRPNGVLAFEVSSQENAISETSLIYLRSLNDTLRQVWSQVLALPGVTCLFMATDSPTPFVLDAQTLLRRQQDAGVETDYLFYDQLPTRLDPIRIERLYQAIVNSDSKIINGDRHPFAFYAATLVWSQQKWSWFAGSMECILRYRTRLLSLVIVLLFILGLGLRRFGRGEVSLAVWVGAMGFGLMGFSVLLVMGFSAAFGSIYSRLGLLTSAFMFGTALGAGMWLKDDHFEKASARTPHPSFPRRPTPSFPRRRESSFLALLMPLRLWIPAFAGTTDSAIRLNTILFVLTILSYPLFLNMAESLTGALHISGECCFYALSFFSGFIGGQVFPLAFSHTYATGEDSAKKTGWIYGSDLVGSAMGAFGISLFLLPLFGLWPTVLLTGGAIGFIGVISCRFLTRR